MPRFKQPRTLQEITLANVVELVGTAGVNIERANGSYDNSGCREQIQNLQHHLIDNIGHFLDKVGNGVIETMNMLHEQSHSDQSLLKDERIFLDILIHTHTGTFRNMCNHSYHKYRVSYQDDDQTFWFSKIPIMTNIVILNIPTISSPHKFFEIISLNCVKLQELTISSTYYDEGRPNDLQFLTNCTKLRVFKDIAEFENFDSYVIIDFIKTMPQLIFFNCQGLGRILATGMNGDTELLNLSYQYASDSYVEPEYIYALSRHCPQLKSLKLDNEEYKCSIATLWVLSLSSLKLMELELVDYPIESVMDDVLPTKGKLLTSLTLTFDPDTAHHVSNTEIMKIGEVCPNLTNLELNYYCDYPTIFEELDGDIPVRSETSLFQNLTSLKLGGSFEWANGAIPLCLKDATRITSITIEADEGPNWKDVGGALICLENPMVEMKTLMIECFADVSTEDVTLLYNKFSSVKLLQLNLFSNNEDEMMAMFNHVEEIKKMIRDNNYDTEFIFPV